MLEELQDGLSRLMTGIGFVVLVIVAIAVTALIAGIPVYYLWNWLMPSIFRLTKISYMQAVGIAFLCRTLFGNISSSRKTNE